VGEAVVRVVFLYKDSSAPPARLRSSTIVVTSETDFFRGLSCRRECEGEWIGGEELEEGIQSANLTSDRLQMTQVS